MTSPVWNVGGPLTIGDTSLGTLTILGGGTVDATAVTIGSFGILNLGTGGSAGTLDTPTITNDGQIVANFTGTAMLAADIDGSGTLTKQGAGTLTLSGFNTYTGATIVQAGTLLAGAPGSLSMDSDVTVNAGATLEVADTAGLVSIGSLSGAGSVVLGDNTVLEVGSGSPTTTFSGSITGSAAVLSVNEGSLTLTGTSSIFGVEVCLCGELTVTGSGASLEATGDFSFGGGALVEGTMNVLDGAAFSTTDLVVTGVVTIDGHDSNAIVQGDTEILGVLGSDPGNLTISGGATMTSQGQADVAGDDAAPTATVTGTGSAWTVEGDLSLGDDSGGLSGILTVENGGTVAAASVSIGSLGVVNLTGTAGARGVLETGFVVAEGSAATLNIDGGILRATADEADYLQGFDSLTIGDNGAFVDSNGHDIGIATDLGGDGGLTKQGTGTLTLTGTNSYTGATTVQAGTLLAGTFDAFSLDSDVTVNAGATLEVDDGLSYVDIRSLSGAGAVSIGTDSILSVGLVDPTVATTFSGSITGGGSLSIDGGSLTLTGASSIGGLDVCDCGSLTLSGAGASFDAGGFGAQIDGTLDVLDGAALSTTDLVVTGAVTIDGPGSTVTATGITGFLAPPVASQSLTVSGGGTLTSQGPAFVDGLFSTATALVTGTDSAWTINDTLSVGVDSLGGSGAIIVADGARIEAAGDIQIGSEDDPSITEASATVTGADSVLGTDGALIIGGTGCGCGELAGILTVENGGRVEAQSIAIGSLSTLNIGAGGAAGTLDTPAIANDGQIVANFTGATTLAAAVSGTGTLSKSGAGTLTLTANSTYTGATTVSGGTLRVNGRIAGSAVTVNSGGTLSGTGTIAGSAVTVNNGGTLAGTGTITGDVSVNNGGRLSGVSGRTLSLGSLTLAAGANVDVAIGSGTTEPLFAVDRDLTLDGTLNISAADDFGPGLTRLFTYGGALTDNGLAIGTTPTGTIASDFTVQTAVTGQVNLVNTADAQLLFWDGGNPALYNNGVVNGGSGTWDLSNSAWTRADGAINGPMQPVPGFAVFGGAAGTVTVDNGAGQVSVTGMQFAVDGYRLSGDAIELAGAGGESMLRVGDGTAAGANYTVIIAAALTGTSRLVKTDLGTAILTGASTYTGGTTISGGTLQIGNGGTSGSITGNVVNNATLAFNRSDSYTFAGEISGSGSVRQIGGGTTILTGANSYTGGTTISGGTLQIGNGGTNGSIAGDVANDGVLAFDRSDRLSFGGSIAGAGTIQQAGTGTTVLTGNSAAFSGATTVSGGELRVDGALGGTVSVTSGATLAGAGALTGDVSIDDGGRLSGVSGRTLSLGSLTLALGANVDVAIGSGTTAPLFAVDHDLTLDGTLNIFAADDFGPGLTRLLTYGGSLTDNGLAVGSTPSGTSASDFSVQTAVTGQVNLVNTAEATLLFWDGGNPALYNNGVVNGGSGTWQRGGEAWTRADGAINGPMQPVPGFAVFGGAAGIVTVDNGAGQVSVTGMQFAVDGYRLSGDAIELAGAGGESTLRVGDGTAAGANYTVIVGAELTGTSRLVKTDLGTAILTGANTYTGGTTISGGTLQIGNGGTRGSILGDVANDGVLAFDRSDTFVFEGAISGAGAVRQIGAGTTILTGANSYTGGTTISDGTLQIGNGGTRGSITGDVANDGVLAFDRSDIVTFDGVISGSGSVRQVGTGTTILTGANSYTGGTALSGGTLQIGNGGTSGSITGNVVNDGVLAFNRSDSYTFAGAISGSGSVRQIGAGTTVLAGANSYTGGTTISGGMLQLGNGGTHGSIAGDVANDGVLAFDRSDTYTFSGAISGSGSVRQVGAGRTVLTGANSYTAGTTISGGTLQIGNGGTNGSIIGDVANDAVLALDRSDTYTFAGAISGSGSVRQIGAGTTILAGANTYAGGTTISSGTLQIGNGGTRGSIVGDVANEDILAFDRSDTYTFGGAISGSGAVSQIGAGRTVLAGANTYAGGTTIFRGTLVGSATSFGTGAIVNDAHLVFDQAADGTFGNIIKGTGRIAKRGAGTLELTGISTWSGDWTVAEGRLSVNGSVANGNFIVDEDADLGGSGTIGGFSVQSRAIVAPGNSIGTLHVANDVGFAAGSTYAVEANAAGRSDKIVAGGSATIGGGAVNVIAGTGDYAPSTTYTILTADEGRSGKFDTVTSNFAFLDATLGYDPTSVYLTLARNETPFPSVGRTRNEKAAGRGIESLGFGNPVHDAVVGLSDKQARTAFDQLSGEVHASAETVLIEDSKFVRDAAINRVRSAFASIGASSAPVATYENGKPQVAPATTGQFAVWGQGFGSFGRWDGDGNAARLTRKTGGFFIGADGQVADTWRIGALGGYSTSSFDVTHRASSGTSDDYHLGVFAGSQWGALGFRTGAASTWHDLSTTRMPSFPGFSERLRGDEDALTLQAFGELGYGIRAGRAAFEPFVNLAYVNLDTESFREHGGDAALHGAAGSMNTVFTTLGVHGSVDVALGGASAIVNGTLGWRHAFGDTLPTARLAFGGGDPFTIAGIPIADDAAVLETGLDVDVAPGALLGMSYSGQFASGSLDQTVKANFTVKF